MSEQIRTMAGPAPGMPAVSRARLVLGGSLFVTLTLGVIWWQGAGIRVAGATPGWSELRFAYLGLLLLCLPVESLASALRIWVLCRVLLPRVSLWTALQAEWANVAMSILTPSQSGGGPGQIYMLSRAGVSVSTALTVSLISFLGTMVGLTLMGLYSLFVSGLATGAPLAVALWALGAASTAMLAGALAPGPSRRMLGRLSRAACRLVGAEGRLRDWWPPRTPRTGLPVDRLDPVTARLADLTCTYQEDVRRFLRTGKASFAWVCLLSLVFLGARCLLPYLCVRFLGIQASTLGGVIEAQMALVFLLFFAPTPGGAGLAEGASASVMAAIVPAGFVPCYSLLWRLSTVYLAAIAGFVCLARAVALDARATISTRRRDGS